MARAVGADRAAERVLLVGLLNIPTVNMVIGGILLLFFGIVNDHGEDFGFALGMGVRGEGGGPSDVAMTGRVVVVAAFGESPFRTGVGFAEGEEIGGDILFGAREAFLTGGELVHESEAEVAFFGREIYSEEAGTEAGGGFPADLAAEAGFIAGAGEGGQTLEEEKENGFEELPIIGAGGEQGAQPELRTFGLIEVEDGEVALTAGGDIETEPQLRVVG
jgi:hypothetical protein